MRELSPAEIAVDNAIQELNKLKVENRTVKAFDLLIEAKSIISDVIDGNESWLDKYYKFLNVDRIICIKEHSGFVVGGIYNLEIKITKTRDYISGLFIEIHRGDSISGISINENSTGNALENFVTIPEYRNNVIESLL